MLIGTLKMARGEQVQPERRQTKPYRVVHRHDDVEISRRPHSFSQAQSMV
jgi:hypothetical protein